MKSKFIKSTIILIIGGFITKILGMIIKIARSLTVLIYNSLLDIEKSSFFIILYLRTIVECDIINV